MYPYQLSSFFSIVYSRSQAGITTRLRRLSIYSLSTVETMIPDYSLPVKPYLLA